MRGASNIRKARTAEADPAGDFGRSISNLIGAISNSLSIGGSRRTYNIGLTEWRLMWVLAIAPPITARPPRRSWNWTKPQ
jgi:hypothetical protein